MCAHTCLLALLHRSMGVGKRSMAIHINTQPVCIIYIIHMYLIPLFFMFQHHRGRATRQEKWVFGLVDTSVQPALGIMMLVGSRDAATLLPLIQQHVRPGTTVWSDEWRAYRRVQSLPAVGQHQSVNHSVNFVDPVSGVHTQHIESYWNRVKTKFKRMKGVHEEMLSSYMDEFMYRERHGTSPSATFNNIIRDIALRYPV